ncbi:replication protein A 70 kDa DNA-binding subunit B-like [Bidens hawaiensis]|uniref:replication protein A 70 kDa DNA-binding subunit B-like n=1 Tax=Bidens hawaiensis TaxID=980011 RepID=UPI00404B3F9A
MGHQLTAEVENTTRYTLSTITKTIIDINLISPESQKLKTWYGSEGSILNFEVVGSTFRPGLRNDASSMYSNRIGLHYITNNLSLGEARPVYYTTRACMSFIKIDQAMHCRASKTCNNKLTDNVGSAYSCMFCQPSSQTPMVMSLFADEAETIIGCLLLTFTFDNMRSKDDGSAYQTQLKKATWVPHVFRLWLHHGSTIMIKHRGLL